jgi:hypothetical protein
MEMLGVDEERFNEIVEILRTTIPAERVKEIDEYIPEPHGTGAILPQTTNESVEPS